MVHVRCLEYWRKTVKMLLWINSYDNGLTSISEQIFNTNNVK